MSPYPLALTSAHFFSFKLAAVVAARKAEEVAERMVEEGGVPAVPEQPPP